MIRVLIYKNMGALEIMDDIRARLTGEESERVLMYRRWIEDNNIHARIIDMSEIEFEHDEDVTLFKLTFGI